MHLPRSSRNWSPLLLIGPNVSMATGTQVYDWASCAYLVVFLQPQEVPSDNSDVAADRNKPVFLDVPSHASAILARNYCPSGRFPSNGSLVTVMCAVDRKGRWSYDVERAMSRWNPPLQIGLLLLLLLSTSASRQHWWGFLMLSPSIRLRRALCCHPSVAAA